MKAATAKAEPTVRPRAWLCQLMMEDGTTRTQFVEEDPDGLRWNDAGEPSPYLVTPLYDLRAAPVAIMDTRCALGLCAPTEADFPALYALQGRRVALVDLGPNRSNDDRETACSAARAGP